MQQKAPVPLTGATQNNLKEGSFYYQLVAANLCWQCAEQACLT